MLYLRPYKRCDAAHIATWILDEKSFYQWSAGLVGEYPLTAEKLQGHYEEQADNPDFWVMTACEDGVPVGQLLMRYPSEDRTELRFGFIVVDASKRGKGYGKRMLQLAKRYAFHVAGAERVTLGVFANNPSAYHCYCKAGFTELPEREQYPLMGEEWECIMMECCRESASK